MGYMITFDGNTTVTVPVHSRNLGTIESGISNAAGQMFECTVTAGHRPNMNVSITAATEAAQVIANNISPNAERTNYTYSAAVNNTVQGHSR